jgi:hypothetical protein
LGSVPARSAETYREHAGNDEANQDSGDDQDLLARAVVRGGINIHAEWAGRPA